MWSHELFSLQKVSCNCLDLIFDLLPLLAYVMPISNIFLFNVFPLHDPPFLLAVGSDVKFYIFSLFRILMLVFTHTIAAYMARLNRIP